MEIFSTVIHSITELRSTIQQHILPDLRDKQMVLLDGPMGVGKTEFVKQLVSLLGGGDEACSPTFALHNEYPTDRGLVDHIDLYRLESEEDLESIGFWDLFQKEQGLILIEWSSRIEPSFLPPDWNQIEIQMEKSDSLPSDRKLTIRRSL